VKGSRKGRATQRAATEVFKLQRIMAIIDERLLDIDRNGATRMPAVMLLGILFLCRYWIVVVAVFVSARRNKDAARVLGEGFEWWFLALELPALLMLLVYALRKPDAGAWVKALWARGAILVTLAAGAHLASTVWMLSQSSVWRTWPELFFASCSLIDVVVVWTLWKDGFYRQLFAEFPVAKPIDSKGKSA
jgi:hypothetical protein